MNKKLPLYLYGTIIILGGIFLLFSQNIPFNTIRVALGISLIIGSVLSFSAALLRIRKQVQFAYHELHALAMIVYGVSVLLFCTSIDKLILFSELLFFFYFFSEIIFCIWLFNLKGKVDLKIIIVRLILGIIVGVGVIFILYAPELNENIDLEGFGVLFILIGVNILLYVPIIKSNETKALQQ